MQYGRVGPQVARGSDWGSTFANAFMYGQQQAEANKEKKRMGELLMALYNPDNQPAVQEAASNASTIGNAYQTAQSNLAALNAPDVTGTPTNPDTLANTSRYKALLKSGVDLNTLNLTSPTAPTTNDATLSEIYKKYPQLSQYNYNLIDSRGKPSQYGGQLEFYPPNERDNPTPGKPTVEVFNPDLKGQQYTDLVNGDMLHHLPAVDPKYAALREQFKASLTPEQLAIDKQAYARSKQDGETRSFDEWMNGSRVDAYIRAGIFPDVNPDWKGHLTPQQLALTGAMDSHLKTQTDTGTPLDQSKVNAYNQAQIPAATAQVNALAPQQEAVQSKLAQAKEMYGSKAFDALAPLIQKGISPEIVMRVMDKQIEKAQAMAVKTGQRDATKQATDLIRQGKTQEAQMLLMPFMPLDAQARVMVSWQPKEHNVVIAPNGTVIDPRTGQPVQGAPNYAAPREPNRAGQLTDYQRYQIEKDKQKPEGEKLVDTPWGKISVAKFIDLHKEAVGGETTTERQDPITGEIVKGRTVRPSKPEILKWSQPIYDKLNATPPTQPTGDKSSLGDPLMDATLAEIRLNGAEAAQSKLAAKVGADKAKQIINQISLFLQEG